jgi:hypothetical protein
MALDPRQPAALGPTAVAVHDDGDVPRPAFGGNVGQSVRRCDIHTRHSQVRNKQRNRRIGTRFRLSARNGRRLAQRMKATFNPNTPNPKRHVQESQI